MPSLSTRSNSSSPADDDAQPSSRYVVGIDLGTTNCALAYVDTDDDQAAVQTFQVTQWVDVGQTESRETLPSFHYELMASECTGSLLPWQQAATSDCVGMMARDAGQRQPGRRISSAKSWLSHDGVDRSADFLPWHAGADVPRMSPVDASSKYLQHLRSAWDHAHPSDPLDAQDVVITLPASFDEVARELTIAAAKQAGLRRVHLIEEPQAAFYAWIDRHRSDWADRVKRGQLILVCDIGGGTTDLTLIRVQPAGQNGDDVQFHRVAVGRHLILGGDNMDLAIAKMAEQKILRSDPSDELSTDQWDRLIASSRSVKEAMLADDRSDSFTVHLPGQGASLLSGAIDVELSAAEVDGVLLDGFFPQVQLDDRPTHSQSGFQEFGLPYASDPAITRHMAEFLSQHRRSGLDADDRDSEDSPSLVLFNGGVMSAAAIGDRVTDSLHRWFGKCPEVLASPRLDLAVAQGAAYYALVRRGQGVRIAANLGRSYYMQVSESPPTSICLIPGNAEAGQSFRADEHALQLQIGAPVQFPLWVSSTRLADRVGDLVEIDSAQMSALPPIHTALVRGRKRDDQQLNVFIESQLSEIGTVGMFCVDADRGKRWKLNFDIRSTLETDRVSHTGTGEAAGIVDSETVESCAECVAATFGDRADQKPNRLIARLQQITESNRNHWPPSLLREFWQFLIDNEPGRRQSPQHESRWINLVGFCLRPGYGVAVDDWRVSQVWRLLHGKLAFAAPQSRTESLILWRRISGGLTSGQQEQLAQPLIASLKGKASKFEDHEANEIWRLLASLELLSVSDKTVLGDLAIGQLKRKKAEKLHPALLWSLGRLGSRAPLYGPLNTTVPPNIVRSWLKQLDQMDGLQSQRSLAIVQMARKTGDRYRDLTNEDRQRTAEALRDMGASAHFIELVTEGGDFDREEQDQLLGDSLPLGISLFR